MVAATTILGPTGRLKTKELIIPAITEIKPVALEKTTIINANQYFERQMEIKHSMVLLRDPERALSIREIFETRRNVKLIRPQCLFVSSDMAQSILKSTLNGYQIARSEIDILGRDIEVAPGGYGNFIKQVANGFSSCLIPI